MKSYLDDEINDLLEDFDFSSVASIEQISSAGEGRLASWMQLDRDISEGKDFNEPLHIAEIPYEESPSRNCICDGWHRLGAAIKYGRKTVPAYIGRKPLT